MIYIFIKYWKMHFEAGMKKDNCIKIIDSIQTCVKEMLGNHWVAIGDGE